MIFNVQTFIMAIGFMLFMICAGCYNPKTFRSDSADIRALDFWSSPRYRIMFNSIALGESVIVEHEFGSPPPIEMMVCLDFADEGDIETVYKHGGYATVSMFDESGAIVFEGQDILKPDVWHGDPDHRWQRAGITSSHPPPDWGVNSNGAVLYIGAIKLRRAPYKIRIKFALREPLPRPVIIYPVLAGGFRSVL